MSESLAIRADQTEFDERQLAALRALKVKNATPSDLGVFFHQAQRTGLDPFSKQIYMIARRTRDEYGEWKTEQTIQVGIDGLRLVARRAANRMGQALSIGSAVWMAENGQWYEAWPRTLGLPVAAKIRVTVGQGVFDAVANTAEYMPTRLDKRSGKMKPTGQWGKMPALMIAKCAEALALRKAFPMDLSGLYTFEEMDQADGDRGAFEPQQEPVSVTVLTGNSEPAPHETGEPNRISATQLEEIKFLADELGFTPEQVLAGTRKYGGIPNGQPAPWTLDTMPSTVANAVIERLREVWNKYAATTNDTEDEQ